MGSVSTVWLRNIALVGLAGVAAACNSEGPSVAKGSEPDHCEQVNRARLECELPEQSCETGEEKCRARCLAGWGCVELKNVNIDPGIVACFWSCAPKFTCDDGHEVYERYRCDGVGDCRDLEDEVNCPPPMPTPASHMDSGFLPDGSIANNEGGLENSDGGDADVGTIADAGGTAARWDGGQP